MEGLKLTDPAIQLSRLGHLIPLLLSDGGDVCVIQIEPLSVSWRVSWCLLLMLQLMERTGVRSVMGLRLRSVLGWSCVGHHLLLRCPLGQLLLLL